jgi:sugar lactone lactonase YvrE
MAGVIYRVSPAGDKSVLVGPGAITFETTNFVAVAPDDSIVFSDSAADKLYRAAADGSGVTLITDTISYPNGLAFSKDQKRLFVASWDGMKVHSLAWNGDGTYGAPEPFAGDVENVDGIAVFSSGDLLFVASGEGLVRYGLDMQKSIVREGLPLGLPANGAFGSGDFGDGWVYVTNLLGPRLVRVYAGEAGAPLPR